MSKVVKLQFFNECRRLGIVPKDINELKTCSKDLFSIANPAFQYKDEDGDTILFDKDDEYKIALKVTDKVLRLTVLDYTEVVQNRIQLSFSMNTSHETQSTSDIKNKIQKNIDAEINSIECKDMSIETIEYKELIDQIHKIFDMRLKKLGILCEECEKEILHVAYVCSECDNFALCDKCQNKDLHEHVLIKAYGDDALNVYNKKIISPPCDDKRKLMIDPVRSSSKSSSKSPSKSPRNAVDFQVNKAKNPARCSAPVESSQNKNSDEKEQGSGGVMKKFMALGFTDINIVLDAMIRANNNFDKACEILFNESNSEKIPQISNRQNRSGSQAKSYMKENLQTLKSLGFDENRSFSALIKNKYDIVKAIEFLIAN
ncbi:hypothetical protein SteCoe_7178 [Stentor coeruleus]|uniref:UBA domain-containing protein n=1 Tax=Stentor coeruleus TaxID=5963 RepID=A0A1R2CND5_9CILI|nr:hypothetical protein SteCoe_7178 [Stentor coeruleus]